MPNLSDCLLLNEFFIQIQTCEFSDKLLTPLGTHCIDPNIHLDVTILRKDQ